MARKKAPETKIKRLRFARPQQDREISEAEHSIREAERKKAPLREQVAYLEGKIEWYRQSREETGAYLYACLDWIERVTDALLTQHQQPIGGENRRGELDVLLDGGNLTAKKLLEILQRIEKSGSVTIAKARSNGGRANAALQAARFQPAIDKYLAEPRLQKMSFEEAAMQLINKHGHNVSHSGLSRKLSAIKKSMLSA